MSTPIGLAGYQTKLRRMAPRIVRALTTWLGHDLKPLTMVNAHVASVTLGKITVRSTAFRRTNGRPLIEHHVVVDRSLVGSSDQARAIAARSFIPSQRNVYLTLPTSGHAVAMLKALVDPTTLSAHLRELRHRHPEERLTA